MGKITFCQHKQPIRPQHTTNLQAKYTNLIQLKEMERITKRKLYLMEQNKQTKKEKTHYDPPVTLPLKISIVSPEPTWCHRNDLSSSITFCL